MKTTMMQGIVLDVDIQENITIIKALTKNKLIYLKAKGFANFNSKNRANLSIGSIVDFETLDKYSYNNIFFLKKAKTIHLYDYVNGCDNESMKKHFQLLRLIKESAPIFYENYFKLFSKFNDKFNYWAITYLLNSYIQDIGIMLNTNYCSICYTNKMLYSFDTQEGGMLCYKHKTKNSNSDLNFIKSIYNLGISIDKYIENTNPQTNLKIYEILLNHLNNN